MSFLDHSLGYIKRQEELGKIQRENQVHSYKSEEPDILSTSVPHHVDLVCLPAGNLKENTDSEATVRHQAMGT